MVCLDGELEVVVYPWLQLKILNPRHPRINPYVNGFPISQKEASSFFNQLFCSFYRMPCRIGRFTWLCSKSVLLDFILRPQYFHTQALFARSHTIQANLARSASFTSLVFLKSRPPAHFGWHSLFHPFQAMNLPSFSLGFHQNLLESESSLSQFPIGTSKEERV